MIPYYILKSDNFNEMIPSYSTSQQSRLDDCGDDEPIVQFNKNDTQIIDGYIKYKLRSESISHQCGRAYGNLATFEHFISINEDIFYYYNRNSTLVFKSSKDIFLNFIKSFKKDSTFKFSKLDVNFDKIINNANAVGVQGIWLGKIPDIHINSLALLGNKVESSEQYKELRNQGAEISNITIIYYFKGKQEKIMITKDGGIILYHHKEETDALELVNDVYNNLLI